MFAIQFSKIYKTPFEYIKRIDKMLLFLGRYGKQDITALQHESTRQVLDWVNALDDLLEEERRQATKE